ncbi:Exodeoxyribonuclease I [Buchnera aphidicola (Cinara pseudotaxifoliae)]|uniref:Exodeoxyribonuclease I n=1 Tax=Buchnera aphidicola (Cinara pseudotaxifoliae) TaxID=655384 RepID=A0A451DHW1_9GAMM|nr:exodeoxyribonuclease I [Buchnera aphidicola]VFP86245.1 Exodeoxyribonuclease I [Buchnera aphidicola (Cinara pseudotaxifoliae)]
MYKKNSNDCIFEKNFIFYDYETFGKNVSVDRIAQFCSIEVDSEFKKFSKKKIFFCYPPIDYLPDPESILITKILPQYTHKYGINEYFFAKKIYKIFSQKNICIVGYNNINFDNLITRNLFYRNLFDPYEWSWKNGNFTWDIINILRAFYIFHPNTMIWPSDVNGIVSFKLFDITKINKIKHFNTHDAYSDVLATFLVAKYLYEKNKCFFLFLYKISHKKYILSFIYKNHNKPFFYLSSYFGSKNRNLGCVMIIGSHPNYKNTFIVIDLSVCLKKIFYLYSSIEYHKITIKNLFDCGIKIIYLNKSPLLFSYSSLSQYDCNRVQINYTLCQKNFFLLQNNIHIKNWIISFFTCTVPKKIVLDVDLMLYKNFFSSKDKSLFVLLHKRCPLKWINWYPKFIDNRIREIFFRIKARNFLYLLNNREKKSWKKHCKNKINSNFINTYLDNIKKLQLQQAKEENLFVLKKLILYTKKIEYEINHII